MTKRIVEMKANLSEFDDLTAAQAKLLVIVQHRLRSKNMDMISKRTLDVKCKACKPYVHVFDPECIDGPIENVPALVCIGRVHSVSDQRRKNTVSPIIKQTVDVLYSYLFNECKMTMDMQMNERNSDIIRNQCELNLLLQQLVV